MKCDFCPKKSHAYASKQVLDQYVFGTDAIYPWKVTEDKKHKCDSCRMAKDK